MKNFRILFFLTGIAFLLVSCNQIKSDAKAYVKAEEDYVKYVMKSVEDDNLTSKELEKIEKKYKKFVDKWDECTDKHGMYLDGKAEFWTEVDKLEKESEYSEDKLDKLMDSDDISVATFDKWDEVTYQVIEDL